MPQTNHTTSLDESKKFIELLQDVVEEVKPIDNLLESQVYQERAMRICSYYYARFGQIERLGLDVDDIFQELSLRVLRHMKRFRLEHDQEAFFGWLSSIVRNLLVDVTRKNKGIELIAISEIANSVSVNSYIEEGYLLYDILERVSLTDRGKRVLELYVSGFTTREIAEIVGSSHVTVASELRRVFKELKANI